MERFIASSHWAKIERKNNFWPALVMVSNGRYFFLTRNFACKCILMPDAMLCGYETFRAAFQGQKWWYKDFGSRMCTEHIAYV